VNTSPSFKARDAASYDPVAETFDRLSRRFSAPLARRMVSLAALREGDRVLDVGTGTGIVALEAVARVLPGGSVLGIDLSEGMLETARTRAVAGAEFRRMDAEALDLEDGSFDVVLSLFALLHFPDPLRALREMHRVLRPGGRLVIAVGSGPPLVSLDGFRAGLRRVAGIGRKLLGRELTAPGFLDHIVETQFPERERHEMTHLAQGHGKTHSVPALVREAGFLSVRTSWEGYRPVVETPEEFWEVQHTYSSLARKRLADATPEMVSRVREKFLEASRRVLARGGRLRYPYAAFFVAARRA
jgi:ubiquinone/menaquinone biosynthesis C-methylase UbiE